MQKFLDEDNFDRNFHPSTKIYLGDVCIFQQIFLKFEFKVPTAQTGTWLSAESKLKAV